MLTAVIVGAGFSGLAAGVQLKRAGIHGLRDPREGRPRRRHLAREHVSGRGVRRPLAPLLVLVRAQPDWSRAYGGQAEILAYLEHCADKYGLRPHLASASTSTRRAFDEATGTWHVTTGDRRARSRRAR